MRWALVVAVIAAGLAALWWGTAGLTVFTAETARRAAVAQAPRPLPAMALRDQDGAATTLAALRGQVVLADFIYTRCPTICQAQAADFEQARVVIRDAGLAGQVALVSITIDPEHDDPAALHDYAGRFGGADALWRFLRAEPDDLAALLRAAAVIVIPDGFGGYVHNAAIHVIDGQGRLVRILDADAWPVALELARQLAPGVT